MKNKIEQVIPEDIQAAQIEIQSVGRHEQRAVAARLRVNPAPHLGLEEELRNIGRVFDVGVSHDHVNVIMVKGSLEGIGVGQEGQQEDDEAKEKIPSHSRFRSFVFSKPGKSPVIMLDCSGLEIGFDGPPAMQQGHER